VNVGYTTKNSPFDLEVMVAPVQLINKKIMLTYNTTTICETESGRTFFIHKFTFSSGKNVLGFQTKKIYLNYVSDEEWSQEEVEFKMTKDELEESFTIEDREWEDKNGDKRTAYYLKDK